VRRDHEQAEHEGAEHHGVRGQPPPAFGSSDGSADDRSFRLERGALRTNIAVDPCRAGEDHASVGCVDVPVHTTAHDHVAFDCRHRAARDAVHANVAAPGDVLH
jgi:hypothetical protein